QLEQILAVQRDYLARQPAAQPSGAAPRTAPAPKPDMAAAAPLSLDGPRALDRLLERALHSGASDLHLHSGSPVKLRTHGRLVELNDSPLDARTAERLIAEILTAEQAAALRERGQVDFAYT